MLIIIFIDKQIKYILTGGPGKPGGPIKPGGPMSP